MKKNKYVVGNLKMNMMLEDVSLFLKEISGHVQNNRVILCPSTIYIPYFLKQDFAVGIQNVFSKNQGAYTGEVSAKQASRMGVHYALVGHSERRLYFREDSQMINQKIKACLDTGVVPMLCIGESREERDLLRMDRVIKRQILDALHDIDDLDHIMIIYEPTWAIGTDVSPSNREIEKIIVFIKQLLKKYKGTDSIPVLYGGSVNEENIREIMNIDEIDGVMIGSATKNPKKFLSMIEVAVNE